MSRKVISTSVSSASSEVFTSENVGDQKMPAQILV
jgi:hypothetical protein